MPRFPRHQPCHYWDHYYAATLHGGSHAYDNDYIRFRSCSGHSLAEAEEKSQWSRPAPSVAHCVNNCIFNIILLPLSSIKCQRTPCVSLMSDNVSHILWNIFRMAFVNNPDPDPDQWQPAVQLVKWWRPLHANDRKSACQNIWFNQFFCPSEFKWCMNKTHSHTPYDSINIRKWSRWQGRM